MPQYKFVAIEGGDSKKSKLTGSIRSHAIRAGLRKATHSSRAESRQVRIREELVSRFKVHGGMKSLQDRSRPSIVSDESMNPNQQASHAELVSKFSTDSTARPPIYPIESVYTGSIDPFNSLPIPTNSNVDYLVKYFLTKFDLNLAIVDRKRSWFPYALQSAPMMHSTLAMTASLWRTECPALESSIKLEGIRQKGEAMREIRTRLAHSGSVYDEDEITFLMSTMATLVIVEVYDGDFEAAAMHLRGVHSIFSSRGGIDSFKDEFVLCKAIKLADIQVAAALGNQPTFPFLYTDRADLPVSIIGQAQDPPLDHYIVNDNSHDHSRIFRHLRQLLLARHASTVSLETLRTLLNIVDDSILQHLYQDGIDLSDARRRSRAVVLAAHVFMYVALRQVPPTSPLVRRLCIRLQSTVGLVPSAREIWTGNEAVLLWIAFVGLLGTWKAAEPCLEGQWFLDLLQNTIQGCSQGLPLDNGSLRGMLSSFLWDEACCQPLLAVLHDGIT